MKWLSGHSLDTPAAVYDQVIRAEFLIPLVDQAAERGL